MECNFLQEHFPVNATSSCFDSLPDEVIFRIFAFIPYGKNNWFNITLTCKRFYSIGGEVFDPSIKYQTPIRWACLNGKLECVRKLLGDFRVDASAIGNRCIKYAAERGHLEIVKALLQRKEVDPTAENNYALRYASLEGHTKIVELLLQDARVRDMRDSMHFHEALEFACERGHVDVMKILLQNKRYRSLERALVEACRSGHKDIVKLLLTQNISKQHVGEAFLAACLYGHYKIAKILLKTNLIGSEGNLHDALLYAINLKHLPLFMLLLSNPNLDPANPCVAFMRSVTRAGLDLTDIVTATKRAQAST